MAPASRGRHDLSVALRSAFAVGVGALMLAACADTRPTPTSPTAAGTQVRSTDFDPADFDAATPVDNPWLPLVPGTEYVYEGQALDDGELIERRVISTVTDMTKRVAGVQVVVIWERDYTDAELEESELAFFAQDRDGNVWHLGEYPEEYDDGKLVKSPGWIAGEHGARAGIQMMAHPRPGTPDYEQGFAPPPINWDDRGRVFDIGLRTCVPVGCYEDVLVIEEFEPAKPGAFQLKYFAPSVGNVRVGWRGKNEDEQEELALVSYRRLDDSEMRAVRDAVVELDGRAFRRLPGYTATSPATS